jgi:undecaprenyl-diphosphatase
VDRENRALAAGFAAAGLSLLFFGWLAGQMMRGATAEFDAFVRGAAQSLGSPWLTWLMLRITRMGSEWVLVPIGGVIVMRLVRIGRRHAAVLFVIAALGGEALNQILKLVFARPRPESAFFGYELPNSYSFPSGHALVSACFYGSLAAILTRRMESHGRRVAIWAAAALFAGSIGFSRIYLGVHYPSDVAAGYAAAIVWVGSVRAGYGYWLRRRRRAPAASGYPTGQELQ